MKIRAVGESVIIRVDLPEDDSRQPDGVRNPSSQRGCTQPPSTGVVVSRGDGWSEEREKLDAEMRHKSFFRFPRIKVGDHVVFTRYMASGTVELSDQGVDYIVLPGLAIVGVIEDE